MELRVGNKYRLGSKIGSGSFGDIFLGALPIHLCFSSVVLSICSMLSTAGRAAHSTRPNCPSSHRVFWLERIERAPDKL
jgi:hypothetical protein